MATSAQAQLQTCQKLDAGGPSTAKTTHSCKVNNNQEMLIASRIPNSDSAVLTAEITARQRLKTPPKRAQMYA